MLNQKARGFLSIFTAAFIFGSFGVLIRELSNYFSDSGQVFARSSAATLIISAIVLYKGINPFKLDGKNLKTILIFSVAFPLSLIAFTIAANTTKVSNALFMLYVGSLTSTSIFGFVILKQKFTVKHFISLSLALIGLCFFVYPFDFSNLSLGLLAGIVAGLLEGTCHTLRGLLQNVKREVVVFYQSASGVLVATIVLMISAEGLFIEFNYMAIFIALIFGALLVAIGYLLVYGFGNFDVSMGTIILSTELFFALIVNAIVLSENPTQLELIGGLLIFSGSIITNIEISRFKSLLNFNNKK